MSLMRTLSLSLSVSCFFSLFLSLSSLSFCLSLLLFLSFSFFSIFLSSPLFFFLSFFFFISLLTSHSLFLFPFSFFSCSFWLSFPSLILTFFFLSLFLAFVFLSLSLTLSVSLSLSVFSVYLFLSPYPHQVGSDPTFRSAVLGSSPAGEALSIHGCTRNFAFISGSYIPWIRQCARLKVTAWCWLG